MFLADTNVFSETSKTRPNPRVIEWSLRTADTTFVSVITVGEITKGIEALPPGSRRRHFDAWLALLTTDEMMQRLLPVDVVVAAEWGRMQARARRTLPCADSLLAATARVHDLTIATRNESDFADLGVRVINPWVS